MRLEGIHHITCITADARRNVDFYARVMGLRMVKKTVNQDQPSVYHLFYADEKGSPGTDLTFFEFPAAAPGRAGRGSVHGIVSGRGPQDRLARRVYRCAQVLGGAPASGRVGQRARGRSAALPRLRGSRARAG